jgi:uncharacterized iron-regulated protein
MTGCASLPSGYQGLGDKSTLTLSSLIGRIEDENLLFMGEGHTDPSDHLLLEEVLRHLHARDRRVVVALEVFPADRQPLLNAWGGGSIDEDTFARECDKIWDDLFYYYGDILRFARDAGIPLYGIGAPRGLINSVALRGPAAIPLRQRQAMRFSGCSENPGYERLMRAVGVGSVHEMRMPFICDAQRMSDAFMAEKLAAVVRNDGRSVVVAVIGAAHASKLAVPQIFSGFEAVPYKVLLPAGFGRLLEGGGGNELADYIWY